MIEGPTPDVVESSARVHRRVRQPSKVVVAAVGGAALVGVAWIGVQTSDNGSSRPYGATHASPRLTAPPVSVVDANSFGGPVSGGVVVIGDVTSVKVLGRPTTWLEVDLTGPASGYGYHYTVAVGTCGAHHAARELYRTSGVLPGFDGPGLRKGGRLLSMPDLPMSADDPHAWLTITRPPDGRYFGGFTGSFLSGRLTRLSPQQHPCTRVRG